MFEYFISDKRIFFIWFAKCRESDDGFIPTQCFCFWEDNFMRTYRVQRMIFENLMLLMVCRGSFFFCTWITVCSDQFEFGLLRGSKLCVRKASVHLFEC